MTNKLRLVTAATRVQMVMWAWGCSQGRQSEEEDPYTSAVTAGNKGMWDAKSLFGASSDDSRAQLEDDRSLDNISDNGDESPGNAVVLELKW